jgi:hypothetical protein
MGHLTLGPRLGAGQAPSWSPSWASDRTRPSDRFHDCAYGYEKLRAAVLAPIVLLRRPLAAASRLSKNQKLKALLLVHGGRPLPAFVRPERAVS